MSDRLALLERAQQGDDDACQQMLTENAGLIWSIVRRYNGCGVETDDLYQLGCIGFVKAVKGFDLTYGTQFSTYAVPMIVECRDNRKESLHDKKTSIEASNSFAFEESRERRGY